MNTLDEFVTQFVVPLVEGGTMHVGAPIDQQTLTVWREEVDSSAALLLDRIDDARQATIAEIVLRAERPLFDGVDLRIVAGLYNMFALAHPMFAGPGTRRRVRERVLQTAMAFLDLPPAADRAEALRRHSLVVSVFNVHREDILVTWWTGRSLYSGQQPPERLLRWPGLRRVVMRTETVSFVELMKSDPPVPVSLLAKSLRLSPLTDLLMLPREAPLFFWTPANIELLRDTELARAAAYRLVGPESDAATLATTAGRAAAALRGLLDDKTVAAADVRTVVAFVVHLNVLLAMREVGGRGLDASSPLLREALGDANFLEPLTERGAGMKWLLSLPHVAAIAIDPVFLEPPGIAENPRLRARWQAHRAQVKASCADQFAEMSAQLSAVA